MLLLSAKICSPTGAEASARRVEENKHMNAKIEASVLNLAGASILTEMPILSTYVCI
jgi:hypothetical protein